MREFVEYIDKRWDKLPATKFISQADRTVVINTEELGYDMLVVFSVDTEKTVVVTKYFMAKNFNEARDIVSNLSLDEIEGWKYNASFDESNKVLTISLVMAELYDACVSTSKCDILSC